VLLDYPAGYVSDRLGYRIALNIASLFGIVGWGIYTVAATFTHVMAAEIMLGISLSFISGSDSALLYETLRAEGKERLYARFEGRMNGFAQSGEALGALGAGVIYAAAHSSLFPPGGCLARRPLCNASDGGYKEGQHRGAPFTSCRGPSQARYALIDNRRLRYTILLGTLLGIASFFPVWANSTLHAPGGVP